MAPRFRRPWFEDGLWQARSPGQPAWVMPPVAHLSNGPCGLTRDPGLTLLPEKWRGSFFLADWAGGGRANSPVIAFKVAARGNGFAMTSKEDFVRGVIPTDVEFGLDGRLYVVDMAGWEQAPGGGRRTGRGVGPTGRTGSALATDGSGSAPVSGVFSPGILVVSRRTISGPSGSSFFATAATGAAGSTTGSAALARLHALSTSS
jgi:hypothetical protein